ncbi:hypothetical protein VTJ83DRAFT_6446 [Remersonia thermophila]|uniref:Uncharacterized protein n=1 Tax=Remersonia thermophila TaxID=72144 RepID=A0ABR4D4Q8_9PEZI
MTMSHLLKGKHKAHASADSSHTATGVGSGGGLAHKRNPSSTTTTTTTAVTTMPPPPATMNPAAPSLRSSSSKASTRAPTVTTGTPGTKIGGAGDRTDALWAEMQATLEAVELSAGGAGGSGSARVFSPDHERKLEGLRAAQIALAQAWARSEADEAIETGTAAGAAAGGAAAVVSEGGEGKTVTADAAAAAASGGKSTAGTGSVRAASSGFGIGSGVGDGAGQQPRTAPAGKVEEETETDILLARKRREANDRYFQRVSQGMLDVVAKLEEVAISMREVEQASKELWGEDQEGGSSGAAKT